MGNPWKNMEIHGQNSMDFLENHGTWSKSKIPWFSSRYFHAFYAGMEQENCKNILHEGMGKMEYKTMGSMGTYKNESMD